MALLREFKDFMPALNSALDCGAGIGRVTKHILKPIFKNVDLVEPSSVQINQARKLCIDARHFY